MRTRLVSVLALLLLLGTPLHQAAAAGLPGVDGGGHLCSAARGHDHRTGGVQLVEVQGRMVALQKVTGAAARRMLGRAQSKHPDAFRRSSENFGRKGYQSTGEVVILKTVRVDEIVEDPAAPSPASTSQSNSEGEIIFGSWDDGDDSTWEGTIHVEKYDGRVVHPRFAGPDRTLRTT